MRQPFAHDARLRMEVDEDPQAVGAAVTVALCGDWRHEPPCPLAPHHTDAERHGDQLRVRVLFATEPGEEAEVRRRIEAALRLGRWADDTGAVTQWQVVSSGPAALLSSELEHGQRLANS